MNDEQYKIFIESDRSNTIDLLEDSLKVLREITDCLSNQQISFRIKDKRWTILEHIGHLVVVEEAVWKLINEAISTPECDEVTSISDHDFFRRLSTGEDKTKAPDFLHYKNIGAADFGVIMNELIEKRYRIIDFLKNTPVNMRRHFFVNPVYGNLDAFQWTLHLSAHCYRHIKQIEAMIGDRNFPKD